MFARRLRSNARRLSASLRCWCASTTALKAGSATARAFLSGWSRRQSLRYAFCTASKVASGPTPSTAYQSTKPVLESCRCAAACTCTVHCICAQPSTPACRRWALLSMRSAPMQSPFSRNAAAESKARCACSCSRLGAGRASAASVRVLCVGVPLVTLPLGLLRGVLPRALALGLCGEVPRAAPALWEKVCAHAPLAPSLGRAVGVVCLGGSGAGRASCDDVVDGAGVLAWSGVCWELTGSDIRIFERAWISGTANGIRFGRSE
mmetsp:Transcript_50318/g.96107  ORF Transcript_50318/g.96107 Transcript_50318/m.96107 type:complete len:264 (-) Transcript_50318:243-1034(-)